MKFYDIEEGRIVTADELRAVYESDPVLQSEYETFSIYLKCCMTAEGGTLEPVKEKERS